MEQSTQTAAALHASSMSTQQKLQKECSAADHALVESQKLNSQQGHELKVRSLKYFVVVCG